MEVNEILKKVRKIEIKSRKLTKNIFAGEYHSAFKGKGMTFAEVREYQFGDDIRNIDWNVTARFNHPYVKIFEEERELTVVLLIDTSGSRFFGSVQLKRDLMAEIAAVIAFSAIQNNDKIGVIFFSDKVEKFIIPKKGRQHTLRIIRELLTFEPTHKKTDISEAIRYLTNSIKKRCTAFLISDFIDYNANNQLKFTDALKIANRKHDIVALQIVDNLEKQLPSVGLIKVKDAENDTECWIDTSNSNTREAYVKWWMMHEEMLNSTFSKARVDYATLYTGHDYVRPLMQLFEKR